MSKTPIRLVIRMADNTAVSFAPVVAYLLRYGDRVGPYFTHPTPRNALFLVTARTLASWFGLYDFMSLNAVPSVSSGY